MIQETRKTVMTSGIPRMDDLLGGLFIGDNVVWYDESGSLALVFWHTFIHSSLAHDRPVIFISFDRSPKNLFERLGHLGKNPLLTVLDCFTHGKGNSSSVFVEYLDNAPAAIRDRVIRVENPHDPNQVSDALYALHATLSGDVRLVFESLTGMQEIWEGEDRVAAFYTHSCPRLYDLSTIAYWVAEKSAHSRRFRARINQIAQVAVDLAIKRGTTTLSVIKAEGREPVGLQHPHKYLTRGKDVAFAGENEALETQSLGARLKRLRTRKGFSQAGIAKLVGVTPSSISQVESNTIYPSVPGLLKISEVLGVEPGYFFTHADDDPGEVVFKPSASSTLVLDNVPAGVKARSLLPMDFEGKAEPCLIEIPAQTDIQGHFLATKGQEMGYLLDGTLRITIDASVQTAEKGDLIYLSTQAPSRWNNPGPGSAIVLWIKFT